MPDPNHDPSIENEPHLAKRVFERDLSERDAAINLGYDRRRQTIDDDVEHTVWDEPALAGKHPDADNNDDLTYAGWLECRIEDTDWLTSWLVTFGVASVAGLFAIGAALFNNSENSLYGIILVVLIGPLTEEMVKIAIAMWVVEKRPFLFKSALQIAICAISGGLVFAAIENLFYLGTDVVNWDEGLTRWRWTVCVALHTGCSFIAGLGLIRVWQSTMQTFARPNLQLGYPFITAAIICHGCYNAFAVALSLSGYDF